MWEKTFGRELHRQLNVPVGLMNASWGGTRSEPWTPPEGFAGVSALSALHIAVQLGDPRSVEHKHQLEQFLGETGNWLAQTRVALANSKLAPEMPACPAELLPPHYLQNSTAQCNGMIHPLVPFGSVAPSGIRGKKTWTLAGSARKK